MPYLRGEYLYLPVRQGEALMALFKESVPREQYDDMVAQRDDWRTRHDALLEKYHALRQTHQPPSKITRIVPTPDTATQAFQAGEAAMRDPALATAAAKLMHDGLSEPEALREAHRLLKIAQGKADAPSFGAALR